MDEEQNIKLIVVGICWVMGGKNDNLNITFSNKNTAGKLFFTKQKSRTPQESCSWVIYKIPCHDCDKCYIGQTGRYLFQRIAEHNRNSE